jgi:PAS domain S-box-containing protein
MLGYSPEELIGKNLISSDLLPEKYHKLVYENMAKNYVLPYEVEGLRKDGTLRPIEIESRNIEQDSGSTIRVMAIRDITERKKNIKKLIDKNHQLTEAKEKLRANNDKLLKARESAVKSELLYRGIVDNLMGGYYRADAEGKLIIASSSAENIIGFALKDFLGKPITSFYVNPAERDSFIEQIKKDGKVYKFAAEFITKNRGNIIIETNAKIIYNDKGEYNGVEGIFYDITEDLALKKKWERELIAAKEKAEEGDQLKTKFLQNMSHEIRTPLNAILGFSSFIEDPELSAEERELYSDIIQKSGNQLLQIVDEIMEMSILESKNVSLAEEPICINTLLLDLYQMFEMKAKEKNLRFNLNKTLNDKQSTLITDKAKLTKILRNLLENAIKYTDSGFVEYGYLQEGDKITFYVKDSGIGILPENQKKVFDRFIQESDNLADIKGGLGLGLSITKENVTLLGGEISLKSQLGEGTEFYVTFPYRKSNRNS